ARAERRLSEVEQAIYEAEEKIARIEETLAEEEVASDWNRLDGLLRERKEGTAKLEALLKEWEELHLEA
ncbi:MAG: hypothetical protein DRP97_01965, partial [Candidatus Latescibacterota bacterium]